MGLFFMFKSQSTFLFFENLVAIFAIRDNISFQSQSLTTQNIARNLVAIFFDDSYTKNVDYTPFPPLLGVNQHFFGKLHIFSPLKWDFFYTFQIHDYYHKIKFSRNLFVFVPIKSVISAILNLVAIFFIRNNRFNLVAIFSLNFFLHHIYIFLQKNNILCSHFVKNTRFPPILLIQSVIMGPFFMFLLQNM